MKKKLIFGAASELISQLFSENKNYFNENFDEVILFNRTDQYDENKYQHKNIKFRKLEIESASLMGSELKSIATEFVAPTDEIHILPTYGVFSWTYEKKNPSFSFGRDNLQINLNARLQIINQFKTVTNVKFHLLESLFSAFPYTGDYALSMWYMNKLVKHREYKELDISVYNPCWMKTKFWNHQQNSGYNPFVYKNLPTTELFEKMFINNKHGITNIYPTFISRILFFIGNRGAKLLKALFSKIVQFM